MRRFAVLGAAVVLLAGGCGAGDTSADKTPGQTTPGLVTKTIESGEVTVTVDPVRIDETGAEFEITLDTHSVELDMDLAEEATLEVDGDVWTGASWAGDGANGHHREGTLSFDPGGPAQGDAVLTIGGFPAAVRISWRLG